MFKTTLKLTAVAALAISSMAHAGSYNLDRTYVSGSIGSSSMGDESSTGFSVVVGTGYDYDVSWLKGLDTRTEIGYLTTSKSTKEKGGIKFETSASAFFAMSRLNYTVAPKIDLVAKFGFTRGKIAVKTISGLVPVESSVNKFGLSYALGGEYTLAENLTAGAVYSSYTADLKSFDALLSYKF